MTPKSADISAFFSTLHTAAGSCLPSKESWAGILGEPGANIQCVLLGEVTGYGKGGCSRLGLGWGVSVLTYSPQQKVLP